MPVTTTPNPFKIVLLFFKEDGDEVKEGVNPTSEA